MKLEDWPVEAGQGWKEGNVVCRHAGTDPTYPKTSCFKTLCEIDCTFGELAASIVEHAKTQHGIEIERAGSWYEAYTPDGKLWCGSSSVSDFKAADLDGMEGEELEHWTAHNAKMAELTYRRIGTYMVDVVEEWKP
jgi:hypothetical protein